MPSVDQETELRERAYSRKLQLTALGGLFLVSLSDTRINKWLDDVLFIHLPFVEVGFALLIAAFLGWAVDKELKRGLVRDAVSAALGYLLPDPLKSELRWVYEQNILASQTYHVRFEHDEKRGIVFFYGQATRILRNISNEKVKHEVGGGIDEWFHPCNDQGMIISCTMTRKNVVTTIPTKSHAVGISYGFADPILMDPHEEIELSFSYRYAMPECGMEVLTFGTPIENPLVTAEIPATLRARVVFSNRSPTKMQDNPVTGYLSVPLKGVLLPFQDIRIYWYSAEQLAARERSITKQLVARETSIT